MKMPSTPTAPNSSACLRSRAERRGSFVRSIAAPGPAVALLTAAALLLPTGGCSDRLLRENVFANTETMLGVQVAQNAKTQMYEARLGFVRHELFLVPTSKRVVYGKDGEIAPRGSDGSVDAATVRSLTSNDAATTPEVLGEIMVDGALPGMGNGGNLRVGVYQRLAVGKEAVSQPAAIALFARDAETAKAAAGAERVFRFGADDNAGKIRAWLAADAANRGRLNAWLANQPNEEDRVRIPALLSGETLAPLRRRAVQELSIPNQ